LDELINYVQTQKKPDLEVHGVDFTEPSASKLVQQNLALSRVKRGELPELESDKNDQKLLIKDDQEEESTGELDNT